MDEEGSKWIFEKKKKSGQNCQFMTHRPLYGSLSGLKNVCLINYFFILNLEHLVQAFSWNSLFNLCFVELERLSGFV